jgi:hypothetical protein
MGYRSEVALAVSKEIMPHFLGVLAKEPDARSLVFKGCDHLDQDYESPGTLLVVWHDIKWYSDTYPEITALQRFVDDCDGDMFEDFENASEHVRFVRLGEESGDVEEKGSLLCYDICTSRSLSY